MAKLFGALLVAYVLTLAALFGLGMKPAIPWAFVPGLLIIIPWGLGLVDGLFWLQRRLPPLAEPRRCGGVIILSLAFVYFANWTQFWPFAVPVFLYALWRLFREPGTLLKPLEMALVLLFLGYGTVWNLNYLGAKFSPGRLGDPELLRLDLWLYSLLGIHTGEGSAGLFPLIGDPVSWRLLEHAYLLYYVETFVVLFVLMRLGQSVVPFLATVFSCFLIGMMVFLIYPTIGPVWHDPDSFHHGWHGTAIHGLIGKVLQEYRAVLAGDELNGFGYFIALPSMHVAVAVVFQCYLYSSRIHFWFFLPINLLMCAATFLLGLHYFVDVPAGVLLAGMGMGLTWLWERQTMPAPLPAPA